MNDYRHGKTRLVHDLVTAGMMDGFIHDSRHCKRNFKATAPNEQPGYFLKKLMERDPERAPMIKELTAEDFNHRQF